MFFTIIIFVAVLAVLVLSHEWGHFFVARKNGIGVDEFGFGFPPRLFGFRILRKHKAVQKAEKEFGAKKPWSEKYVGQEKRWQFVWGSKEPAPLVDASDWEVGTLYSINLLPLGGFVKIKGENSSDEQAKDKDSFFMKKAWQKAAVLCAGVGMNIVVAFVLITLGMMIGLPQDVSSLSDVSRVQNRKIEILEVVKDRPAEKAGVEAGDAIIRLDALDHPRLTELQSYVDQHQDAAIMVTLERGGEIITKQIQPTVSPDTGKAGFGVGIIETGMVRYPWYEAIYKGFITTFELLWAIMVGFYTLILNLVTGHGVGAEVSGPVGVAKMTGQVARMGIIYLIQFTAMLSLNLAVLNILPIPALDGGRLLFVIIGKIMRRPVTPKIEQWAHVIGFMLLMLVVILATGRDLNAGLWLAGLWHKVF